MPYAPLSLQSSAHQQDSSESSPQPSAVSSKTFPLARTLPLLDPRFLDSLPPPSMSSDQYEYWLSQNRNVLARQEAERLAAEKKTKSGTATAKALHSSAAIAAGSKTAAARAARTHSMSGSGSGSGARSGVVVPIPKHKHKRVASASAAGHSSAAQPPR